MRYYRKREIILSEDTLTEPKEIRFQQEDDEIDLETLIDGGGNTKTYPTGTHSIDLSEITLGKWLYIKADKEITISIDAGPALTLIAGKPSEMWLEFASLSIVTTEDTRITIAIAGE